MFLRLCENEFNVARIERTEEYLGLPVGLCAGAKSELMDGYASGLDYVREHKTISLLLLLQLKVRTEKNFAQFKDWLSANYLLEK